MRTGNRHDDQVADVEMMTSVGVGEADADWAREVIGGVIGGTDVPVRRAWATLAVLAGRAVPRPALIAIRVAFDDHTIDASAVGTTMREAVLRACGELRRLLADESAGLHI